MTASISQKHQTVLEKHHVGVPTDTPSSGDFDLEKEKQKAQQALEEGERWGLGLFPPFLALHFRSQARRWSLQIKPLTTLQGFGCGSGGDGERTPFGKSGVGVCARGCV